MRTYTDLRDAIFEELFLIAKKDKNVVVLMADQDAFSFGKFRKEIPGQLINVGIAEQNMVSVAAGLTLGGKKVFIHAIINFLTLRAYEQIKVDLGIMQLPVVLVGVGVGDTYRGDGPTHHSNQDLAVMRAIPGLTILCPSDTVSLAAFTEIAYRAKGPVYIRFEKGNVPTLYKGKHNFNDGIGKIKEGKDAYIISTGIMVHEALAVAEDLKKQGTSVGVLDLNRLKPVNQALLKKYLGKAKAVITMEEHLAYGGLGSIVADFLADNNLPLRYLRLGYADKSYFIYGDRNYMLKQVGLDAAGVSKKVSAWMKKAKKK